MTAEEVINRRVSLDELAHELARPIGESEREDALALVRWFTARYPSADARLAYVRQAHARWQANGNRRFQSRNSRESVS